MNGYHGWRMTRKDFSSWLVEATPMPEVGGPNLSRAWKPGFPQGSREGEEEEMDEL